MGDDENKENQGDDMAAAAQRAKDMEMAGQADVLEFAPKKELSLMGKVDQKASETIEIKKGTLWLIAIAPAFLTLAFSYGGSIIGWARSDQTKEENIKQVQSELKEFREKIQDDNKDMKDNIKELNNKFDKISERQYEQEKRYERIDGFKAGVAESQSK